ncbi:MAG: branched-chain amino acid transaminase [Vicinamibacteria bacterium]|jgi:branched-chain amino acid aminotransferase|nr:branched-chain amino acid transaminase [Vicinamibacteria bacterium]
MTASKPNWLFHDGQVVPYRDVRVGLMTHSLNYGTGAFGGLRGYWSEEEGQLFVFRPREHMERFLDSARLLRMQIDLSVDQLLAGLKALLRAEDYRTDCYVRALLYFSDEVIGVRLHGLTPHAAVMAVPFGRYVAHDDAAHVTVSSWRRVSDNAIPPRGKLTGAYVGSALIKSDAELAGFDEALVLDESGHVCEGTAENIFVVRKGRVVTPAVTSDILEGIVRRSVITLMQEELGLQVDERSIDRSEVLLADEVFMTGTGAAITAVTRVDHRPIGSGVMGKITTQVRRLYDDVVHGRVKRYREWCWPIYGSAA